MDEAGASLQCLCVHFLAQNNGIDASCPCDKLMRDEPSDISLVSTLVNYSSLVQQWEHTEGEKDYVASSKREIFFETTTTTHKPAQFWQVHKEEGKISGCTTAHFRHYACHFQTLPSKDAFKLELLLIDALSYLQLGMMHNKTALSKVGVSVSSPLLDPSMNRDTLLLCLVSSVLQCELSPSLSL